MEVSAAVVPTTMVADRPETKAPKGFHSFLYDERPGSGSYIGFMMILVEDHEVLLTVSHLKTSEIISIE